MHLHCVELGRLAELMHHVMHYVMHFVMHYVMHLHCVELGQLAELVPLARGYGHETGHVGQQLLLRLVGACQ